MLGTACLLELRDQIGEHTAGNLIEQGIDIHLQYLGIEETRLQIFFAEWSEIAADFVQLVQIKSGVIFGALQGGYNRLCGRLTGTERHW